MFYLAWQTGPLSIADLHQPPHRSTYRLPRTICSAKRIEPSSSRISQCLGRIITHFLRKQMGQFPVRSFSIFPH